MGTIKYYYLLLLSLYRKFGETPPPPSGLCTQNIRKESQHRVKQYSPPLNGYDKGVVNN